jgi:CBASS immunity sensor of nucleotide second messenger signals
MGFWNWFSRLDNVIGVLTAVFSGYAAWKLRQQSKRLRELAERSPKIENIKELIAAHAGVNSSAPVAFAVSLIPSSDSIKNSVQTFLDFKGWKMPIEELNMDGINGIEDLDNFVNRLRVAKRFFDAQNFTEIHLFFAGPVPAGVLIGAMFDNWKSVKLYHKPTPPQPQVYEYWMPLTK